MHKLIKYYLSDVFGHRNQMCQSQTHPHGFDWHCEIEFRSIGQSRLESTEPCEFQSINSQICLWHNFYRLCQRNLANVCLSFVGGKCPLRFSLVDIEWLRNFANLFCSILSLPQLSQPSEIRLAQSIRIAIKIRVKLIFISVSICLLISKMKMIFQSVN